MITQANNAIKRYTGIDSSTPKYRTDKMDFRVRRVPKELMEKVFVDPKNTLPAVVSSLVSGVTDQFLKAKILHDWICDNIAYDTSMYFSGRISAQDYVSVLKKKKAVCSGYANLFEKMCEAAGIEAIVINGYSKGFGYTGKIGKNTDHAWNAVYIGSKWYLIDVTWDAGHLDRRTFIKEFSTQWLFLDPRPFLYSHLPQTDAHQFYAPVLTAEDFMREAYIAGSFFHYGLALKSDLPEYNNTIDGEFNFDIIMRNSNVSLTSQLRTMQQQNVDASSWTERKGNAATVSFDVPDNAAYKGHIFARLQNEERLQTKIGIGIFEQEWLQKAEALFAEKKITEKELAYFKNSYFKVAENNSYYFFEDQFDTPRNNAVSKIHKLLELSIGWYESVLDFNIKAAPGYQGFGSGILKYPFTFSAYNNVPNTQLISPATGILQAESTHFVIASRDYTAFAIVINGKWHHFSKNSATGNYELSFAVPDDVDFIEIYAGKGGNSYHGLVRYAVSR